MSNNINNSNISISENSNNNINEEGNSEKSNNNINEESNSENNNDNINEESNYNSASQINQNNLSIRYNVNKSITPSNNPLDGLVKLIPKADQ